MTGKRDWNSLDEIFQAVWAAAGTPLTDEELAERARRVAEAEAPHLLPTREELRQWWMEQEAERVEAWLRDLTEEAS